MKKKKPTKTLSDDVIAQYERVQRMLAARLELHRQQLEAQRAQRRSGA